MKTQPNLAGHDDTIMSAQDSPPRRPPGPFTLAIFAMLAGLPWLSTAWAAPADDYPARSITMIVPFPAGGPTDKVARIIADHMSGTLGRQVIVQNMAGAGGAAATRHTMGAPADGYTIELGNMGTHAAVVALSPKPPYNPVTDFEPVGLAAGLPVAVFTRKNLPARNLAEFAAYAKANPGRLSFAHAGAGSASYSTCLLLNSILEVEAEAVLFNGGRAAMSALSAGQVDYLCDQVAGGVVEFTRGGVKALAVAGAARSPVLPGVPTTTEAGLAQFQVGSWNALFAPRGTPKATLDKLTAALDKAQGDEPTRRRLNALGCDIPDRPRRGQAALTRWVKSEIALWTAIMDATATRKSKASVALSAR